MYTAPSGALANTGCRCFIVWGRIGTHWDALPVPAVLGEITFNRRRSQSTLSRVRENGSDGVRSPCYLARQNSNRHSGFWSSSISRSMVSAGE